MALSALPGEILAFLQHPDFSQSFFKLYCCCAPCGNFFFPFSISSTLGKLPSPSPRKSPVACEKGPKWLWEQGKEQVLPWLDSRARKQQLRGHRSSQQPRTINTHVPNVCSKHVQTADAAAAPEIEEGLGGWTISFH